MSVRAEQPAFPYQEKNSGDGSHYHSHSGMSLRDWFAGQALVGFLAQEHEGFGASTERNAQYAYEAADAMLAERAKGGQQ